MCWHFCLHSAAFSIHPFVSQTTSHFSYHFVSIGIKARLRTVFPHNRPKPICPLHPLSMPVEFQTPASLFCPCPGMSHVLWNRFSDSKKKADAVNDLAKSMAEHWSCVTFHHVHLGSCQYGQVNLHAWKVHVLLFSHGDVIHDLTTYPFGWYLLLESTNTADCTSKKTRPLLSQKSSPQLLTFKDNDHQPPEWCYLHCKPCRASLITTVTFWELTAVKGLAWQLWATAGRTRPRWCHRPDQLSSVASRSQKSPKHQLNIFYVWYIHDM